MSLSSQAFVTVISIVSGVWVFVTTNPSSTLPSTDIAYVPTPSSPVITSVVTSDTVYTIAVVVPAYFARSSQVCVQSLSSLNTAIMSSLFSSFACTPFANNLTVTLPG